MLFKYSIKKCLTSYTSWKIIKIKKKWKVLGKSEPNTKNSSLVSYPYTFLKHLNRYNKNSVFFTEISKPLYILNAHSMSSSIVWTSMIIACILLKFYRFRVARVDEQRARNVFPMPCCYQFPYHISTWPYLEL